jgi:ribose/xylose/arabinose/galactoside ABC-type transport system permease subunit
MSTGRLGGTAAASPFDRLRSSDTLLLGGFALVLAVVVAIAAFTTQGFVSVTNLRSILAAMAFVGIIAVGTSVLMISGNLFSLSLGVTAAVTAMTFLTLLRHGVVLAIVATLALGAGIGAIQGVVVGAWRANPIILSIAAGAIQEGVALWLSNGGTIRPPAGETGYRFLTHLTFGIPFAVYVLFAGAIVLEVVVRTTRFGTLMYLVGENWRAARAASLPTTLVATGAFAVAGLCAAIAGVEIGAFNASGSLLVEGTLTYDAIAAAVVGGIAITGGRGSVLQAVAGSALIAVITNILLLRGYSAGVRITAQGLIVVAVVVLLRIHQMRRAA